MPEPFAPQGDSVAPLLPEIGVLGLVPDYWGGPCQVRHQVLTRLAGYFNVVWVDPAREWRESWRLSGRDAGGGRPEPLLPPGFEVYRHGRWLPKLYRPRFLASFMARERLRRAMGILHARGCRKTILYLWRPEFAAALDLIGHDLSCYHIDDEYSFAEVEQPIEPGELELITRADQVIVHSPALMEKKGRLNPETIRVPNGVDYNAYSTPRPEPADMAPIPHPRVGYVGMIKKQLDISLLLSLARRHQGWSFVVVGPKGNLGEKGPELQVLARMKNVHLLGGKPIDMLPAYTQWMDVCILNYELNGYTKFIYPLKLHEYLASGRPVVGSPIRALLDFAHVIELAGTSDEWSRALAAALDPRNDSAARVEQRRCVARGHDWDVLVRRIAATLCRRLGAPYSTLQSAWI